MSRNKTKKYHKLQDLRWAGWLKSILGEENFEQLFIDLQKRVEDFQSDVYIHSSYHGKFVKKSDIRQQAMDLLKEGKAFYKVVKEMHIQEYKIRELLTEADMAEITAHIEEIRIDKRRERRTRWAKEMAKEGENYKEIAKTLGISESTAWGLLNKGMKKQQEEKEELI